MLRYKVFLVHGKIEGIEIFGKRPERDFLTVGVYRGKRRFTVHVNPLGRGKDLVRKDSDVAAAVADVSSPDLRVKIIDLMNRSNCTMGDVFQVFAGANIRSDRNFTRR